MDTEPQSTLSAFTTIWLTLVSGIVLVWAAQSYWRKATRAIRKSGIPALLGKALDRLPVWTNAFGFVPAFVLIVVVGPMGFKLLFHSGMDNLLRIQVGIAYCVTMGHLARIIVNKSDARAQELKPIHWVPITAVTAILLVGTLVLWFECPVHLAELWWTPCFNYPRMGS